MIVHQPWAEVPWLLSAGSGSSGRRIASLIEPGSRVNVFLPARLRHGLESAFRERGVTIVEPTAAETWIRDPDDLETVRHAGADDRPARLVLVAESAAHGSRRDATGNDAPDYDQITQRLSRVAGHVGFPRVLGRQHCIEPYEQPEGATKRQFARLRSDPSTYIDVIAMLFGDASAAAPGPLFPAHAPTASVLFLSEEPPANWDAARRRRVLELLQACQARGRAPVLSWSRRRLSSALETYLDYARMGIIVHGGDGVFDDARFGRAIAHPPPIALLSAYDPDAVVLLDAERFDEAFQFAVLAHPGKHVISLVGSRDDYGGLVDAVVTPERGANALTAALDAEPAPAPPRIALLEKRSRVEGLTSVVIPVHGALPLTMACLESLERNTTRPLEIIIVDNASPDDTRAVLRNHEHVRLMELDRNTGFAAGSNTGLREATGEWVCFLNNDTEVTVGWLDALVGAFSAHADTGMAGPRSNRISGRQVIPDGPPMPSPSAHAWAERWTKQHRTRTWLLNRLVGFCLLARGEDLERLGGFDEGVGIGNFEDDDLGNRIRAAGRRLRVADGAVVLHHGSATFHRMGISWIDAMKGGARHAGSRWPVTSDLGTGVVVSTRDSMRAAETAADLLALCDRVLIAEPGATLQASLAAGMVASQAIDVVSPTERGTVNVASPWAVVAIAGTRLPMSDWGGARSALERLEPTPRTIAGTDGRAWLLPAGGDVALNRPEHQPAVELLQ